MKKKMYKDTMHNRTMYRTLAISAKQKEEGKVTNARESLTKLKKKYGLLSTSYINKQEISCSA